MINRRGEGREEKVFSLTLWFHGNYHLLIRVSQEQSLVSQLKTSTWITIRNLLLLLELSHLTDTNIVYHEWNLANSCIWIGTVNRLRSTFSICIIWEEFKQYSHSKTYRSQSAIRHVKHVETFWQKIRLKFHYYKLDRI